MVPLVSRVLNWLLIALLGAGLACATAPRTGADAATALPEAAAGRDTGRLFLWEVTDSAGARAHLLGSVHVARKPIDYDPAIFTALEGAETVVMEVDPQQLEPESLGLLLAQKGRLPAGVMLQDVVSEETHAALREALAERGMPLQMVEGFKPWFAMFLLLGAAFSEQGLAGEHGVETHLAQRIGQSQTIVGLESASFQIEIFDSLSYETQELVLRELLDNQDAAQTGVDELLEAWENGDIERMEALGLARRGEPAADAFYDAIYFRRNHNMAKGIAELLDRGGDLFVVIGALHMVGAQGIPALMAERGYSVRQLDKTPPPSP